MAGTNNGGGMPKTQGKFGSKEELIKFIAECGKRCEKFRAIAEKAGVSRSYVVNIFKESSAKNKADNEKLHAEFKTQLAERDAKIGALEKEISELSAIIKLHKGWPKDESRIDIIGTNGPTGEHYE